MEKKQTHIIYGLIIGITMAVVSLIVYMTGISFKPGMEYVSDVPFIVGIILNGMAYSKANDGFVTFGNVFGSCFKATMIVALVMAAWAIVTIYAFPEMKEKAIELTREAMSKNPKVSDDVLQATINSTKKYWTPIVLSSAIFGTLFAGAVFSLIGGAVARKKGERPMTSGDSF